MMLKPQYLIIFSLLLGIPVSAASVASTPTLLDFETVPVTSTQPSLFAQASQQPQMVTVPNVAAISGGVILGNATNFPAQSYATSPNAYGTANIINGSQLLSSIMIAIDPSYTATEVSFPLFNGLPQSLNYIVTAYDGSTVVSSMNFSGLAGNLQSGHTVVDLTADKITSVTIAPEITTNFDFAIDSVAFNESVAQAVTPSGQLISGTPEPQSIALFGIGLLGLLCVRRRKSV